MRKKLVFLFALAATVAATAAVLGGGVASADPGNGNGATVVRDPYGPGAYCNVTDFVTFSYQYIFQCKIQRVTTGGPSGQVNEYIKGPVDTSISSPLPTSALQVPTSVTGELCDITPSGFLVTTQGTITPSGQVNLTCRLAGS